jgi:branched-subunit amino acid aminotransferase/4-amino-4-deoxychorismate lyase
MTTVFLNGKFYGGPDDPPIAQARVGAFDAGLQHAVGLFETMLAGVSSSRSDDGTTLTETWVLHLDEHLQRLEHSAKELGLSDQLRTPALADAVVATVARSGLSRARVRLTITGGDLSMLASAQSGQARSVDPTVMIVAQPATQYPAPMFERGVMVSVADARVSPFDPTQGHKTLNYWWRLRELQLAAAKGAGEALILSVTNHLCSGCVSNLLIVKGDTVYTPIARGQERGEAPEAAEVDGVPVQPARSAPGPVVLPSPVLPGVTRAWAMRKAELMGYQVKARMLGVEDLLDADEAMLTNSSWGVLPVVALEAAKIGDGKPGRLTLDLRDAWLDLLPG